MSGRAVPALLQGEFYEAGRSRPFPAQLQLLRGGRFVLTPQDHQPRHARCSELGISPRLGNLPRRLEFPDGSWVEVADNDAVDRWLGGTGARLPARLQHFLERRASMLFVLLVLSVLVGWWFVHSALPATGRYVAFRLEPKSYRFLDHQVYEQMTQSILSPSELPPERAARMRQLFEQVRVAFEPELYDYRLKLHSLEIGPNAFALPGGLIVMGDELVELAEDDVEIISVLAHEMAHVQKRHGLRGMLQASLLSLVATLTFGDVSGLYTLVFSLPIYASYSRGFETEADCSAVRYMRSQELDPRALGRFLRRMESAADAQGEAWEDDETASAEQNERSKVSEKISEYLSTHPPTEARSNPDLCVSRP